MSFVLYENSKQVGPVSDWSFIAGKTTVQSGSTFGGGSLSAPVGKEPDRCQFRTSHFPSPTASLMVVFENKTAFDIKITKNQNGLVQAIVTGKRPFSTKP